jgi:deazaflavin-dependent oxidoreductase (nitroreductase family)
MSFDAHDGTRGGRTLGTGGPIGRWFAKRAMNGIRRTGKVPGLGFDALVLTTIGRKSGVERQNPVGSFKGKDGSWLIVASANGARKNPNWYHNIAAHPDRVRIETAGRTVDVVAEQLHGTERDEAWKQITTTVPRFAKYEQKTDREIPVIRLVQKAG